MSLSPVQQIRLLEGLTPRELEQLRDMEDRLRKERQECDRLQSTITSITGDKVDVRRNKTNLNDRAAARNRKAARKMYMSPKYRPQTTPKGLAASKKPVVYTNFSRSPRFAWQRYEQTDQKTSVPDITHLHKYPPKPRPSPGPGEYDIPVTFSPHKVVVRSPSKTVSSVQQKRITDGRAFSPKSGGGGGGNRRKRSNGSSRKRSAEVKQAENELELLRRQLAEKESELRQVKADRSLDAETLQRLQIRSTALVKRLGEPGSSTASGHTAAMTDAEILEQDIRTLSAQKKHSGGSVAPPPPAPLSGSGSATPADDLPEGMAKELHEFIEQQLGGEVLREWDAEKHEYVELYTSRAGKESSDLATKPALTKLERVLTQIFRAIDMNNDQVITGEELAMFLRTGPPTLVSKLRRILKRARPVHKHGHLFDALDINHDKEISKEEWFATLKPRAGTNPGEAGYMPPPPLSADEKLRHIFRFFCSFGERFQDTMSGPNFTKLLRDCDSTTPEEAKTPDGSWRLLDERNLTLADLGILYNKVTRFQNLHAPKKSARMSYDTFLMGLRELALKRYPAARERESGAVDPESASMALLLSRHILPLYNDAVLHSNTAFAHNAVKQAEDITRYRTVFLPSRGVQAFLSKHEDGLRSIFQRYAALNAPSEGNSVVMQKVASSSWNTVREVNESMDWSEFNAFIIDFGIVPKMTSRVEMQRIFSQCSQKRFVWKDNTGQELPHKDRVHYLTRGQGNPFLTYEGFCDTLGILCMNLFDKREFATHCPTNEAKMQLLFFKMDRPSWLLKGVEKKLAASVDSAVRANILQDARRKNILKYKVNEDNLQAMKDVLTSFDEAEQAPPPSSLFD